nr:ribonuclease H-like domain-containing protein [Tanacetum cinerariifolium]
MVLENDGVVSKTTKEKVKSLALKAKITMEQTSDDSDSQKGDLEEIPVMVLGIEASEAQDKSAVVITAKEGHFIGECFEPKENKAFVGGAWSDSKEGDELQKDATCLMAIDSHEEYDSGHVVFGSNLKGKVISGGERMALPNNPIGSLKNMLNNQIFKISSDDSHASSVEMYLLDEEDDCDSLVIPQTPNEEIRTRIDNTRCPFPLLKEALENQLLSVLMLICLGKHDCVERIPSDNDIHSDEEHPQNPPVPLPTQQIPHTVSSIKLPVLKKDEYDNGNGHVSVTTDTNGLIKVLPPKTAKEVLARERERKARTTLLMALTEDHLAKFHKMTDAKEMWKAIKSRFDGNNESKKMHKYLFQTLLSQLEIHGAGVSNEDANQKFLRSLPSSWSQVALIMRTKPGIYTLSFDDLYNNLRVFERDVKGTSSSSSNIQNVAFVSAESTSSTNEVSTAYGVSSLFIFKSQKEGSLSYTDKVIHSIFSNQSSAPQLDYDDLEKIDDDNIEEMDLKWQTKVECFNCHKIGHFTKDCRSKRNQDSRRRDAGYNGNKARENGRKPINQDDSKALITIDGHDIDWSRHVEEDTQNYVMMAYSSSNSDSDDEAKSCSKACDESYVKLKKLYDDQREKLGDASVEIKAYTLALKKVEAQLVCHQQNQLAYEEKIRFMRIDLDDKTDVLAYHKKLLAEALKEKEELKTKPKNWQNSSKNLGKLLNTQMSANDKFGLGYGDHRYGSILSYENEVLQSVFINKASDLEDRPMNDRFVKTDGMHATKADESDAKTSEYASCESDSNVDTPKSMPKPVKSEPKVVYEPKVWSHAPIIEEYESDSDDDYVSKVSEEKEKPSFASTNFVKHVKTPTKNVKEKGTTNQSPKFDKKDWNGLMSKRLGLGYAFTRKACFVCGSFSHLIRDCDFHEKRMAKQVELNKSKNKVLSNTGRLLVNTARQNFSSQAASTSTARKVNTARTFVNETRPKSNFYKSHSPLKRTFNSTTAPKTKFSNKKDNTIRNKSVSAIEGNEETAVKASADCNWRSKRHYKNKDDPHKALKDKGIMDSRCFRHMTWNKAHLADYQDFKVGSIAFGGSNSRITGKGKIKTGKLDFEDVYFVEELKHYNLFSVSRICDKKNKVLFADMECLVLSSDFKLPDENQVLLKIPRQHNMYSFNLKNIDPFGDLACLIAKATIDESNKWDRRLGYVNFKNLNKLVKRNLVRGLPFKIFKNDIPVLLVKKFDGKFDSRFLVGYSLNSKAFRVYNLETKRVEENLHVNFLENKPNVTGKGHAWMFDLDYLTNFMNYKPITGKNQANKFAGPKEVSKAAIAEMYDEVQAGIEADALFTAKLQQEEREEYTIEERAKFLAEMITDQRRFRAAQRSNMGGYKYSQLKAKTFAGIQGLYERQKKVIDNFKPMDSNDAVDKEKVLEEPDITKVEVKQEGDEESIRKRLCRRLKMKATKKHEAECIYYRIFRSDGSSRWIKMFSKMVTRFDRMDLEELYNLVMQRVHTLTLEDGTEIYMLAERRYPLTKETLERMLALRLIAESESEAVFYLLRFIQKYQELASPEANDFCKELASPKQTALALAILEQTATEVPSFDEPEPQPLLNGPSLDVSLGGVIGPEPPIKPHSPDSSRMKVVDYLTTQTPPSPHVVNSYPKGVYSYYNPERGRILEAHRLESILQQQISQRMAPSHHDGTMFNYNRKGFLEDDDARSDDLIFIVDPGWDDYCLQAIKLNRPVPLCPEARRARM